MRAVEEFQAWLPVPGSRFFSVAASDAAASSERDGDGAGPLVAMAASTHFLEVALALNEGQTAEQVVDLLFETLDPVMPVDRIGIAMLESGDRLVSRYVRSRMPVLWGVGSSGVLAGSSLEPIVNRRLLRIIDDLEAYSQARPESQTCRFLLQEGMRSNLTLPLLTRERVSGVVFFACIQPGAYTVEHLALASTLALSLGVAIERGELVDGLRQANAELSTLDELKTNFLSTVSHELRTPLHKVTNYVFALQDELAGPVSSKQRALLREVMVATERMSRVVNDLLDFTALGAGRVRLKPILTDLNEVVRMGIRDWEGPLKASGLTFKVELSDHPVLTLVDPSRIARLMAFLLENAQTFTPPPGRVTLAVSATPDRALLAVQDTGIGISPQLQRQIFEKFFQVDHGLARRFGGMGLGLTFAKAIAEAHGGEIQVNSTLGKGATFTLALPRVTV